ncbi:competence/damage-inducible protein cinA [Thermodesulfobium acidiphilum]|uniref:Competence/damage-inducible protein cinA n=1 Tax=Thermodesulfobium acidiphilum TaxID=1794699 RepID=A0A2R4W1J7_THEAF|nr:CinA family protein [Thermodesulfobium acidiphilum]AWB10558.1 competence/damage-inducible protein cinA [Thermodesulfobium acidiphilum]
MKVALLCVGSELTIGAVSETNSNLLSSKLEKYGHEIETIIVIPDDLVIISAQIQYLCEFYDYIFISGGLGNTFDDLTREAVSNFTKLPLEKNLDLPEKMAYTISGAQVFLNKVGLAPGMIVDFNNKKIILLPGVPAEFDYLLDEILEKLFLENKDKLYIFFYHLLLRFERSVEKELPNELLNDFEVSLTILGLDSEVLLILKTDSEKKAKYWDKRLKKIFKDCLYYASTRSSNFETEIYKVLKKKNQTLSVAESCTGGLLSSRLAVIPGISSVYLGTIVAYSVDSKKKLCGFSGNTVSPEAALAIAKASKDLFDSNWAIGVVCYAGPDGGNIGQSYISIVGDKTYSFEKIFKGDRSFILKRVSSFALANFLGVISKG